MNILDFNYNWNNKLTADIFSTLRLSARFDVGDIVEVHLNGKHLGNAECIHKEATSARLLSDAQCLLDTGYFYTETLEILKRMYKGIDLDAKPIYYYLFKWKQTTGHRTALVQKQQLALSL
jgi:hypothetical protein